MSFPKTELLTLIVGQLKQFGLHSAAKNVADVCGLEANLPASDKLSEYCYLGSISADQDDENEIIPEALIEDEDLAAFVALQGLDLDVPSGLTAASHPTPEFTCWFTGMHRGPCTASTFSKDGRYIATGSQDSTVKVIDVSRIHAAYLDKADEKPVIRALYDHTAQVNDLKFHPNGKLLASASDDCNIKFYDLTKSNIKRGFRVLYDVYPVRSISFHPSGDYLISGTFDSSIRIFDIHTLQCYQPFENTSANTAELHTKSINMVEYGNNGNIFVCCSEDGTIKLYDTQSGKCINTIEKAHQGKRVSSVRFSRNGKYLLSAGGDSIGRLWDVTSGNVIQKYEGATQTHTRINSTFSKTEDYVVSADETSNSVVCWNTRTGELLKKFSAHSDVIRHVNASSNDEGVMTCADDMKLKYWHMDI